MKNSIVVTIRRIIDAIGEAIKVFFDTMNSNDTTNTTPDVASAAMPDTSPATAAVPAATSAPAADSATPAEPSVVPTPDSAAPAEPAPVVPVAPAEPAAPATPVVPAEPAAPATPVVPAEPAAVPPTVDTPPTDEDTLVQAPVQEKQKDLDKPEVRLKTSISMPNGGYVTGFSIQGRSHILMNKGCEDYHAFEDLGDGWYLAITSDGAGSARESARGSKANCELATRLLKQLLAQLKWKENAYMPTEVEWHVEIKNIFEVMQSIIIRSAASQAESYKKDQEAILAGMQEQAKQLTDAKQQIRLQNKMDEVKENIARPLEARDFNATIILMLITPQGMLTAHIGDGRMGYMTQGGQWKALMTPHKGEEASATVFLPNNWNRQLVVPIFKMSNKFLPETHVIKERPKAFVLMSDGCESFSWTCSVYDKEKNFYYDRNEPFERFLNPLIDALNQAPTDEERVTDMIDIINIGTTGGKKEQDDRTMLLGVLK